MDPGTTIDGKYRVEHLLGKGAMGSVYQCSRVQDLEGHRVAVKVINPEHAADPRYRTRFQQEARALTNLFSDYAVKIHDGKCSGDGVLYLVMELLEGRALDAELDEDGPMRLPRALIIVYQACEAVAEVHQKQIIHRDLKPANLFIQTVADKPSGRPYWRVKVLDFGVARLPEEGNDPTVGGFQPGTPVYMSPEQTRGEPVGPATDVWALGVILYELVAGAKLWQGTLGQIRQQVLHAPAPSIRDKRPEVPKELDQIIHVCLQKEPSRRYPSVEVLGDKLRSLIQWLRRDPAWDTAFHAELQAQESLSARFPSAHRRSSETPEPCGAVNPGGETLPTVESPMPTPLEDSQTTVPSAPSASGKPVPVELPNSRGPNGDQSERLVSEPALLVCSSRLKRAPADLEIPAFRRKLGWRLWAAAGVSGVVGIGVGTGMVLSHEDGAGAQTVIGSNRTPGSASVAPASTRAVQEMRAIPADAIEVSETRKSAGVDVNVTLDPAPVNPRPSSGKRGGQPKPACTETRTPAAPSTAAARTGRVATTVKQLRRAEPLDPYSGIARKSSIKPTLDPYSGDAKASSRAAGSRIEPHAGAARVGQ